MRGDRPSAGRLFVGRGHELDELRAGLDDAFGGRARFFLIAGEAGIGKTRLVEELANEAARRAGVALWGRCWEGAGAPPYRPWVEVIRAHLRSIGSEPVAPAVARQLAQIVPELGDRSPDLASISLHGEHARFYLFDAVATVLRRAAERNPLVVVIDDLQWADEPSLLLLQFLVRELRDVRALLLATYREVEVRHASVVADALGALAREGSHLSLRGFDEDEVGTFIRDATERSVPAALVHAVHRETEGNPFFVDEIVRLLIAERALEQPDATPTRFPVPQGVRAAIRRRLAPLPQSCREALALAAVIGREFDLAVLERACGLDGATLLERLDPAATLDIVVRESPSGGRYRFAHVLIRETLYEALGPADRARNHARIGEVIEELHRDDPTPQLASLAHHFLEALPVGYADKAIAYCARAGRHAAASLGYEAAAAHFDAALDALAHARPADEPERCELLLARGDAQARSVDGRDARETFREAAELARRLAAPALLARAALGFAGEGSRVMWIRSGVVDQPRVDLLEEALRGLGDRDSSLRARLLARLAINLYWARDPERGIALSEEAVEIARTLGDPRDLAAVLRARWVTLWRPDGAEERLAIADELVSLGERTGDREVVLLGRRFRIVGFLERGDVRAADGEIDAWARIAGELRQPLHLADLAVWRATRATMDGRFSDAEAHAQRAYELGEHAPDLEPAMRYGVQTSVLQFHRGDLPPDVGGAAAPSYAAGTVLLRCQQALFASETGRTADARRELAALAKEGFGLPRDGGWLVYVSLLAGVAAEVDDSRSAAALYELLQPYADRLGIVGAGLACWGSVSLYLGLLAGTLGRITEAKAHLEDAATVHERIGAQPFLAWTRFALGNLLLRCDAAAGSSEAKAMLGSAFATARELGMERLTAKIRRLGVDFPVAQESGATDATFRREGDFWIVGYAGQTVRLRHAKGLADIAILLAAPGRQVHVADMIAASAGAPVEAPTAAGLVAEGLRTSRDTSDGALLDRRARDDYRGRLAELNGELADAERCNDAGRAARARAELDFIAGELASAFGIGGRSRRAGSPVERARKAVASRIRFSVDHIGRVHPRLADHLRRYIRTGTLCSYVVPDEPLRWRV